MPAKTVKRAPVSKATLQVKAAIKEIESKASKEIQEHLKQLNIVSASFVKVDDNKKAIAIVYPRTLTATLHKVQAKLTKDLEKKFDGHVVVFIAQREIRPKTNPHHAFKVNRQRPQTLTAVHEAMLHDIVYPSEVVGERLRVRVGGSKLKIVLVDSKEKANVEPRLKAYAAVYKKLTGNNTSFEFPVAELE